MSRVGKTPVQIPKDITVADSKGASVTVRGPNGELTLAIPHGLSLRFHDDVVDVEAKGKSGKVRALHGLMRTLLANAVRGVKERWTKTLELVGVGYRASLSGENLVLTIGFSHSVTVKPPAGISFQVNESKIVVSGVDKHMVGQIAARIRDLKKPEPYKGKGIRYEFEHVRKKAGKAKVIGGAPGASK